jgi:hypothetical protein
MQNILIAVIAAALRTINLSANAPNLATSLASIPIGISIICLAGAGIFA